MPPPVSGGGILCNRKCRQKLMQGMLCCEGSFFCKYNKFDREMILR